MNTELAVALSQACEGLIDVLSYLNDKYEKPRSHAIRTLVVLRDQADVEAARTDPPAESQIARIDKHIAGIENRLDRNSL